MDNTMLSPQLEHILQQVNYQLDRWRQARSGAVIMISGDLYPQMVLGGDHYNKHRTAIPIQAFSQLSIDDLDQIAELLGCVWATHPRRRLYYLIPKELCGGEGG